MNSLLDCQDSLTAVVIGAILAALDYIAKWSIEILQTCNKINRLRRSSLIYLQSLLTATKVAFEIQQKHAKNLLKSIEAHYPDISKKHVGYEEKISRAFPYLNTDEKELHAIIRSITTNALCATNKSIVEWLKKDTYFKARKSKNKILAEQLQLLESHLMLWIAKFEAWFPNKPEHAINYMNDEKEHGLGFPHGIDKIVNEAVSKS